MNEHLIIDKDNEYRNNLCDLNFVYCDYILTKVYNKRKGVNCKECYKNASMYKAKVCNRCGGPFYNWKKVGNKFRPDCPKCNKINKQKQEKFKQEYAVKKYSGENTKYRRIINEEKIIDIMNT
jgi:hypothetical protein